MRVEIDPRVDSITMPENLKVGLMVAEARENAFVPLIKRYLP
jgi:hypothetical protein